MQPEISQQQSSERRFLILLAWFSMLLISDIPDIVSIYFTYHIPEWIGWGQIFFLILLIGTSFVWKKIQPLRPFFIIMLVFFCGLIVVGWLAGRPFWQNILSGLRSKYIPFYTRQFLRDILFALIVIAGMWILKRKRSAFFLVRGDLQAPIEPVRWLGIKQGESWHKFGWIFGVIAMLAVAIPTLIGAPLSGELLGRAFRWLPFAILLAMINAFTEEMYYRAPFLSTLPEAIGKDHALLICTVFFGLEHWLYGSPPGLLGAAMTGFLAWLIGKSMLETKGLFWPWLIHVLPDIVVFFSYALYWE